MISQDLVLSSGFLAFARHAGFLSAVEHLGLMIDGVCGTSSGALVGALWSSGMPATEILRELTRRPPLGWTRLHTKPWQGLFSLDAVVESLRERLPSRFDALPRPFGVGVVTAQGEHRLLTKGPLPEAVAASCAVPWLFTPIEIDGHSLRDGAVVDRTALAPWRAFRPNAVPIVHIIDRTGGAKQQSDLAGLRVVCSPRSEARLWSHGDVEAAFALSRSRALEILGA